VEQLKIKVDLRKSYLNHLLVLIVTIGASIGKMFIDNRIGNIFYAGVFIIVSCIIAYVMVSYQLEKKIKDIK